MKPIDITPDIIYFEPDSMRNFKACAGILAKKGDTGLCIDLNLGEKAVTDILDRYSPDSAFITHYHVDHSIWLRTVARHGRTKIFIPEPETGYVSSLDFVLAHTAGKFGMADQWRAFIVDTLGYAPISRFTPFTDRINLDEYFPGLTAIATPGHSPGHTSFYFSKEKILFSGDMGLDKFGPWYGWADCSIADMVQSILSLSALDIRMILTSHGGIVTDNIRSRWKDCLRHLLVREEKIQKLLRSGKKRTAIIDQGVFFRQKSRIPEPMQSFLKMWDTAMFTHHEQIIEKGGLDGLFPDIRTHC